MATLAQIQAQVDTLVTNFLPTLSTKQTTWLSTHINYWQGIKTPPTIPIDGILTAPNLTLKPRKDKEAASWNDLTINFGGNIPCSIEIFKHSGPLGKGYTVRTWISSTGTIFYKSWGVGQYSDNSQVWTIFHPTIL